MPLLIEDYSASEDIFTRAAPLLVLVAFVEVLGAIDLSWPLWANLVTVTGALAVPLGAPALRNRAQGRRAPAIPERVGALELAGFVLLPALLLQRPADERAGHRRGQRAAAAVGVGRRRLRAAVDRALGGRAAADPARGSDPAGRPRARAEYLALRRVAHAA